MASTRTDITAADRSSSTTNRSTEISRTTESTTLPHTSQGLQTTETCLNGGHWNGSQCVCPANFTGSQCQYALPTIIIVEVNVISIFQLKITNQIFNKDLSNTSSAQYHMLANKLTKEMQYIYSDIPEFHGITNIVFTNGSVNASFDVHLTLKNVPKDQLNKDFNDTVSGMVDRLQAANQSQDYCQRLGLLCFRKSSISAVHTINYTDICGLNVPKGYSHFYSPSFTDSGLTCTSACSLGAKNQLNCHYGECGLTQSGPVCVCPDTSYFWYSGDDCQYRISRPGVIGGVTSVLAACLILIVILVVMLTFRRVRKLEISSREKKESSVGQQTGLYTPKYDV